MATGTRAPRTIVTINLQGQNDFHIPFEYLARKFVVVTLLGVDRKVLELNTDYRFVSKTVISLVKPHPAGYTQLELRRETPATERLVDYHDGSILRAYDLNLSQIQTLHVAEEARDLTADTIGVNDEGHLDARNRKIVNLAYAENGGDAIPLVQVVQWNDSALNSANRAELSAEKSKTSEINAQQSAVNAQQSEVSSKQSEVNAKKSETASAQSAVTAKASEAIVTPLVPVVEQAAADAKKSAAEAAQAVIDIKDYGGVPVGTINMYGTTTLPAGYLSLMEDAPTFNVNEYPELARLYPTGRLPSYKGRTPEGVGDDIALGQLRDGRVGSAVFALTTDNRDLDHQHIFSGNTHAGGLHSHSVQLEGGPIDGTPLYPTGRETTTQWSTTAGGVIHAGGEHSHVFEGMTSWMSHTSSAYTHNHNVQGTVGEGRNLVAATGTIFAIKAKSHPTDTALFKRLEELERKLLALLDC